MSWSFFLNAPLQFHVTIFILSFLIINLIGGFANILNQLNIGGFLCLKIRQVLPLFYPQTNKKI